MTKEKSGGQYEKVLEGRHLLVLFFLVVLLCGFFFTLGFVLGRNQERAAARAAELKARSAANPTPSAPESTPTASPTDLGFYERLGTAKPQTPKAESTSPKPATTPAAGSAASSTPAGASAATKTAAGVFLQVAAVTNNEDAERLGSELRRLGFPAVVVAPASDRFYRVQVGPFSDAELAAAAQRRLEAQGFRVILKR